MTSKKELKELEKKKLEKAAQESEENRLKVERIERLEKDSKNSKNIIILNALASALFGLSTILYLTEGLTTNPEVFREIPIYCNTFCSVVWGLIARMNYKDKKIKDELLNDEKREVLGYSK